MDHKTLLDWVALHLAVLHRPRLGAVLLAHAGTPTRLLHAPRDALPDCADSAWAALQVLRAAVPWSDATAALQACERRGIALLCRDTVDYPPWLHEIADPPLVLFVRGDATLLQRSAVAVVGTRKPSPYGVQITDALVAGLQQSGLVVVSGLAFGIDAAAHRAALAVRMPTVAVLASGVDYITPRGHYHLGERIAAEAVLCSEYPPGMGANPFHYPQRNRIISGLSLGVVVVEGAVRSGTMWTARHAAEQGRLVFAVPGGAGHLQSAGPHHLIREGAILVERAEHIVEALAPLRDVPVRAAAAGSALPLTQLDMESHAPSRRMAVSAAAGHTLPLTQPSPQRERGVEAPQGTAGRYLSTSDRQRPGRDDKAPDPYGLGTFLQIPRQLPEIVARAQASVGDVLQWLTHAELSGLVRRDPRGYVL
ncbi:MAG: DNA-protecting protein DprA [Deltaproteobacteria bacterium]|nr:DNA-protecting protein DprA [Deltaproteobacteria bacterium]